MSDFKTRIIHKHDVEENWLKATAFIPKKGEIIVYDPDDDHASARLKIGDGTTLVSDLPFIMSQSSDSSGDGSTGTEFAQVQTDWLEEDETSVAYLANKPELAPVATSGSYNDLENRPSFAPVATKGTYASLAGKPFCVGDIPAFAETELRFGENSDEELGTFFGAELPDFWLIPGETYRVVWNGDVFTLLCKPLHELGGWFADTTVGGYLGNGAIFSGLTQAPDTLEPFFIFDQGIGVVPVFTADTADWQTISVTPVNAVKKLDQKYLPDDVVTQDELSSISVDTRVKYSSVLGKIVGDMPIPLPETTLTFEYDPEFDNYKCETFNYQIDELIAERWYLVVCDGESSNVRCEYLSTNSGDEADKDILSLYSQHISVIQYPDGRTVITTHVEGDSHIIKINPENEVIVLDKKYLPSDLITEQAAIARSGSYGCVWNKVVGDICELPEVSGYFSDGIYSDNYLHKAVNPIVLVKGEIYTVTWDGAEYTCLCEDAVAELNKYFSGGAMSSEYDVYFFGNLSYYMDGTIADVIQDSGEPFLIMMSPLAGDIICKKEDGNNHTVSIVPTNKVIKLDKKYLPDDLVTTEELQEALDNIEVSGGSGMNGETDILPEQEMSFHSDNITNLHVAGARAGTMELISGETYIVSWDGTEYKCVAADAVLGSDSGVGIGNLSIVGIGDDTGEPFAIGAASDGSCAFYTTDTSASHAIRIYQKSVSGGVSSWNDLTDKPFGEKNISVSITSETVNPDVVFVMGDVVWVKTSNEILMLDEIIGATFTIDIPGMESTSATVSASDIFGSNDNGVVGCLVELDMPFISCYKPGEITFADNGTEYTATPQEPGLYTVVDLVESFPVDGRITITNSIVKKLDARYLPDDVATKDFVERKISEIEVSGGGSSGGASAETDILPEQKLEFSADGSTGMYFDAIHSGTLMLVSGETYKVSWDGTVYECVATEATLGEDSGIALGNLALVGVGEQTPEPFVFGVGSNGGGVIYTTDTADTHTVRIYQGGSVSVSWNDLTDKPFGNETVVLFDGTFQDTLTEDGTAWNGVMLIEDNTSIGLKAGATYEVEWNGSKYVCEAFVLDGVINVVGNPACMGGADNGLPFGLTYDKIGISGIGVGWIAMLAVPETDLTVDGKYTCKVSVVEDKKLDNKYLDFLKKSDGKVLYNDSLYDFAKQSDDGVIYISSIPGMTFELINGDEYDITWDGKTYHSTVQTVNSGGTDTDCLGNIGILAGVPGSGEPFVMFYLNDQLAVITLEETNAHAIKIVVPGEYVLDESVLTIFEYQTGESVLQKTTSTWEPNDQMNGLLTAFYSTSFNDFTEEKFYVGAKADVTIDGKKYATEIRVTEYFEGAPDLIVIGNGSIIGANGNDEPFAISLEGSPGAYVWAVVCLNDESLSAENGNSVEVSIEVGGRNVIKSEFLPDGIGGGASSGSELPDVTADNNGQVLTVVDGAWRASDPSTVLPAVTAADAGKILMVGEDGSWIVASIPSAEGVAF